MERRYDFDWLRVFAFAVLIFYHVGMLYVEMTAKGDLDVNHLWYLRELWCFSLILLFIHPILSVAKINNIFDLIGHHFGFSGILILALGYLIIF
jgi:hypothetical protein